MFKYKKSSEPIFAMSNVRGKFISREKTVNFSFHYSPRNSSHGPRVKVVFNPGRMRENLTGTLKLCDDWEFIPGKLDKDVSVQDVRNMKSFFRKYLILFLLVWEGYSDEPDPQDYLQGNLSLHEIITNIDFYDDYKNQLDKIQRVEELESFCRENNLVNMYGN